MGFRLSDFDRLFLKQIEKNYDIVSISFNQKNFFFKISIEDSLLVVNKVILIQISIHVNKWYHRYR